MLSYQTTSLHQPHFLPFLLLYAADPLRIPIHTIRTSTVCNMAQIGHWRIVHMGNGVGHMSSLLLNWDECAPHLADIVAALEGENPVALRGAGRQSVATAVGNTQRATDRE